MRKVILATGHLYHIYNRGVDKREIFSDYSYYSRFISTLKHYLKYNYPYSLLKRRLENARSPSEKQSILLQLETRRVKSPVEIVSFCLMPNHYHLTLKQSIKNGISKFMHRIGIAYTTYFNIRKDRTGRLFEAAYKAVMIDSDEQLFHLTRYQHINPHSLDLATPKELIEYPWSSLSTYLGGGQFPFIKPKIVMSAFRSPEEYLNFVSAEIDEFEPLRLQGIALDDDFGWFAKFRALKKDRREQLRNHYLEMLS